MNQNATQAEKCPAQKIVRRQQGTHRRFSLCEPFRPISAGPNFIIAFSLPIIVSAVKQSLKTPLRLSRKQQNNFTACHCEAEVRDNRRQNHPSSHYSDTTHAPRYPQLKKSPAPNENTKHTNTNQAYPADLPFRSHAKTAAFSDGTTSEGETATYTLTGTGILKVILTVVDNSNGVSLSQQIITPTPKGVTANFSTDTSRNYTQIFGAGTLAFTSGYSRLATTYPNRNIF